MRGVDNPCSDVVITITVCSFIFQGLLAIFVGFMVWVSVWVDFVGILTLNTF